MEIILLLKIIFAIILLVGIGGFFIWLFNKVIQKDREKEADYNFKIGLLKYFLNKSRKERKHPSTKVQF